jgi:hypothetical protein
MMSGGDIRDVFASRPRFLRATLLVMFTAAIGIRLVQLDAPGMLADRDYTSAMFARAWFFEHRAEVPEWRREMAAKLVAKQPVLEPPVTEWLASLLYRAVGSDDIRLGRLVTVSFWLVGGILLFLLARRLVGTGAAVLALAYYLFLPLAVLLSRSFQADALMMMLFIASLLAIVRHHQSPTRSTLAIAALLSAITLVYRPLVMPALVAVYVLPVIRVSGWRRGLLDRASLAYVAIATLPAFAYYGYGAFVTRYFQWKLPSSFMFSLYGHHEFWREWFLVATSELGVTALVLASIGVVFVPRGLARTVLVALGLGYLCFGLAFTYHIHTHGYYQAQLIPAVAIAAAPLTLQLIQRSFQAPERWVRLAPLVAGCLVAGSWWIEIREKLNRSQFESPQVAMTIGELVKHSDRVVYLSPFYGLPLQYLGEFTGAYWPRSIRYWLYRRKDERALSISERLAAIGFEPEYFVITHFREYANNHEDLRRYLESNCRRVALEDQYRIYHACLTPAAADSRRQAAPPPGSVPP